MADPNKQISMEITNEILSNSDIFENFVDDDGSFGATFTRDIAIISTILICIIAAIYGMFIGQRADMIGTEQAESVSAWITEQEDALILIKNRLENNPELMEDPDSLVRYLYNVSMQHASIAVTFICSENWEQQMYSSDGWIPDEDYHLSEKDYYVNALQTDGLYMTDIYVDTVTGQLCLSIGMKVNVDGYTATVGADIYLDELVNLVNSTSKGVQYASLVVDDIIVVDPSSEYALTDGHSTNINYTIYSSEEGSTFIWSKGLAIANTTNLEGTNWQIISVYRLNGILFFFAGLAALLLMIIFIMRI